MRNSIYVLIAMLTVSVLIITGCKKKDEPTPAPAQMQKAAESTAAQPALAVPADVDIATPVAQLQAKAETMDVKQLQEIAMKYQNAINGQNAQLDKIMVQLKEIPAAKMLGEEAKTLKTELDTINTSIKALQERFQVYYDQIKAKGGDISSFTL